MEKFQAVVLVNLRTCLKSGGVLLAGDDIGHVTQNKEFHKVDTFSDWGSARRAEGTPGEIRVNKRVRSLADWAAAAAEVGLRLVDVIRTDRDPSITTPENDLLVLENP